MSDRIDYRYNAEERVKLALSLPQSENEVPALVVAQIATAEAVLALVDATRAADTIDALVKEMHARELHHFEEEQKSAGLAAVVEKVRGVIGAEIGWESPAILIDRIEWALSTAPTDALAEHDAALMDSLASEFERAGQYIGLSFAIIRPPRARPSDPRRRQEVSDYTPSTGQVRSHYVFDQSNRWDPGRGEAFDRWLAERDARLIEGLADDLVVAVEDDLPDDFLRGVDWGANRAMGWIRERARLIREGAQL